MTPAGFAQLRVDEGLRLHAYPDPLTNADPWTIGYGHTGPDVHPGLVWTEAEARATLQKDVQQVEGQLDHALGGWWRQMCAARQDCLINMGFNLGVRELSAFKMMLGYLRVGKFGSAALDMLSSEWARQVKGRADRLAAVIRNGAHPA